MNKSVSDQQKQFVSTLQRLRESTALLFPLNNSFIRYDLILAVLEHELEDEDLTFKKLYTKLKHSDIGIRNHLIKLAETEWIHITTSKLDGRSKIIRSSDKLRKNFEELNELNGALIK